MSDRLDIRDANFRVLMRVSDPYLRLAATAVLGDAGFEVVDTDDGTACLVTDDARQQSNRTVLIAEEGAVHTDAAVRAFLGRKVAGIASRARPDELPLVVQAVACGFSVVPGVALDSVMASPSLPERQAAVLRLVAAGLQNGQISERLCVSQATVKRDISALLSRFGCSTRLELAMRSRASGLALETAQ